MIYSVKNETMERRSWEISCRSNAYDNSADTDGEKKLWRSAKTLDDLGELTARWIEGKLSYHPCCQATSDDIRIAADLAALNRSGLVTMNAQPAAPLGDDGCSRRACVEGYATEEVANSIAALGLYSQLLVMTYPPDWVGGYEIAISLEDYRPATWSGASWGYEEQECFLTNVSQTMIDILALAWKVVVIDLQWGREEYLWDQVRDVLHGHRDRRFCVTPGHPGEITL